MGIERYRAIVKLEDIRTLFENGEYAAAKEAADSIRKERLKDSADLFLLAAVYRKAGDYRTAKEFLLRIYEKKITWRVLEELMEVCLAEKNPEEAEIYLKQYCKISGGDPRNYIYEYRIGRQMHRPDEELLPILQTLKAEEYTEKYAYELAKLYHKLGREQECMTECADLILWFGEGTYVERAKALQAYYRGELSADDIRSEAERRIKEAEERKAREEAERRAYEEEKERKAEEERKAAEEAKNRSTEEERRAQEEEQNRLAEEERRAVEEELHRFEEEECRRAQEEPRRFEELEEALEEAAATDMSEPMWEPDASFPAAEEENETVEEEAEAYEQISLFAPQEAAEEIREAGKPEESDPEPTEEESKKVLTEIGAELSARLSVSGVVFEDALHEYARIESVRKQLIRMLEVVISVRKKCHCLIITGEKQSGKTTLGTYLAKLLYELSYVKSPRVAKIGAQKLNQIKLQEKKEQLRDCCLIVEGAGSLTEEAAAELLEFISHTDVLGAVILEDNANAMNRLLRNHAECNRMFNNRVHLPKYDSSELMSFALGYIKGQDYEINSEAKKILKQKIEHLTRVGQKEGRLAETMKLVKSAIENADYRNQGTILAMAAAGNFLAAGAMELTAEDFGVTR